MSAPDPLDIPAFLIRKGKPAPTYAPARPLAQIIEEEHAGGREKWQERNEGYKQVKKDRVKQRLAKLKSKHPGERWNPKLKKWVPTTPRKKKEK